MSTFAKGTFDPLVSLKTLDLSKNQITSLDSDIFSKNLNLESIDFTENYFVSLPIGLFNRLPNLKSLNFHGNINLKEIGSGVLNGSQSLQNLRIDNCHLEYIAPDAFSGTINLKNINFDSI